MKNLFAPWRMEFIKTCGEEQGCFLCRDLADPDRDAENMVLCRGRRALVVLNRFPYSPGHMLIAPHRHSGDLNALGAEELLEMMQLAQKGIAALRQLAKPHGFNLGINLEKAAGAGVADHLHLHLLPRWVGDTNFMPTVAETKVIPQSLQETYRELAALFGKEKGESAE